jgi:sRNA-binding protein
MNKKMQMRDEAVRVIAELAVRWPATFHVYEGHQRPLALGIHDAILEAGFPAEGLVAGLRRYVASFGYLRAMTANAVRINLAGEPAASSVPSTPPKPPREKLRLKRRREAQQGQPAKPAPVPKPAGRITLADLRVSAAARKAQQAA